MKQINKVIKSFTKGLHISYLTNVEGAANCEELFEDSFTVLLHNEKLSLKTSEETISVTTHPKKMVSHRLKILGLFRRQEDSSKLSFNSQKNRKRWTVK